MKMQISEDLEYALRVDPEDPQGEQLEVVQEDNRIVWLLARHHLHLQLTYERSEAEDVLLDIVRGLEELLRSGSPANPGRWAHETLVASLANRTQPELGSIIRGFHLENHRIKGEPRYRDIAKALRSLVLAALEPKLTELVTLWKSRRVFEEAVERRRRRPARDPQVRRDRALTPNFIPRGRT